MPSLDFEKEKSTFREYYSDNIKLLEGAIISFKALISALLEHDGSIYLSKVEGRVKEKEECIRKFNLKYRKKLEADETEYTITEHISDLVGLRVVCLYEDDIDKIKKILKLHFDIIDETDKISQIESTEGSFGYKGLHLDLKLGESRKDMPEYKAFVGVNFEIQIRTIIQDSWSVLDHKIKYKKSIPNRLKRRINTLAALFELADREFKEIRVATDDEIKKAEEDDVDEPMPLLIDQPGPPRPTKSNGRGGLTAFGFLRIAKHFFKDYEFDDYKVDGFTDEIVSLAPNITRNDFNEYMKATITKVKQYKQEFEENPENNDTLNPYTVIRHCLYLRDQNVFSSMLTNTSKNSFDAWLAENPG
ncbi:GTP pyrophosphokinase [Aeromonas hydrophila]|uniref:Region found in RelA / SpoT proteins n=1 Tax=Aeromonas hydrophila subsp. hydrophila (strain ATCC 7966 / DSM 30187 / BCRC 13018 / CCUG 14551 / JCM 1027 / KCTC 2358 / NCIMB 9240 / NCTC 8049) TaxID=380703 RepID=A0KML5_AERHH|nr:(p)ppGpp synthetase [Aeromonas hydrophila]ABK38957.1 region found in RelA / SpoT proteins [Aeromonas hydrophila subsp. hydrophila ATCC 7966]MBS4672064.1 (p)ppGpp synthetase [Aeromonas hydrophila]NLR37458.1 (p)ppGpp synthetase [Aeromonas hydrophila]OOD35745.1 (p)ppGpp synthetase [Aeromonas hydrophila]SUU30629.1 region found in RelA / SpoT proteins [Aeromonas hydrophila]